MGTNYYLIDGKRKKTKQVVNEKIKALAEETITKLKKLVDVSSYERSQIENAINAVQPEQSDDENIHIGKNSFGWRFTFNARVSSVANLETMFNPNTLVIEDEYGREVSLSEMKEIITKTLANPKRNNEGEPLPENSRSSGSVEFNPEGYSVMSGEFS